MLLNSFVYWGEIYWKLNKRESKDKFDLAGCYGNSN